MENYLLDLIKNNIRIIIPDFGALIVSSVNEKTTINFNSYLKFNDGVLIGHISNEEGIDSIAAAKKVEEFVKKIIDTLDKGNKFIIEGLGVFSKDISGGTRFSQFDKNTQIDVKPEIISPKTESPLESNDDLIDIEVQSSTVQSSTVQSSEVQSSKFKKDNEILNPKPETLNPKPETLNPKPETLNPKPETLNPKPETLNPKPETLNPKPETLNPEKQKKGFPIWIPIVIIVVLLLLAAAAYYFFIDERTFQLFKKQTVEEVIPEIIEPVVEIPEIIEPVIEEPVATFPQHHIILGSFKEQQKADQLLDKLRNKGYTDASIFERNGYLMVSVEWHSSVRKALERQEILLQELRMDSWVLTLKK